MRHTLHDGTVLDAFCRYQRFSQLTAFAESNDKDVQKLAVSPRRSRTDNKDREKLAVIVRGVCSRTDLKMNF